MKTWVFYLFVLLGSMLAMVGALSVGMYLWEALIVRWGDSDQSLIFWYLPFLFIGVMAILAGLFMVRKSINKIRLDKHQET